MGRKTQKFSRPKRHDKLERLKIGIKYLQPSDCFTQSKGLAVGSWANNFRQRD
ncbi:MAG: hypothetical protein HC899_33170 [Leptolyngbyaceae cyanobacterium SM1_4_3]|nr:hypothetical protein [Leptolyngbyaceae cyanobacterium SM1_4_3]